MYDDESKRMLQEVLETTRENNKLLKRLRRSQVLATFLRIVFWAIVLGVPIYLYFSFLRPIIAEVGISFDNFFENIETFREAISEGVSSVTGVVDLEGSGTTKKMVE